MWGAAPGHGGEGNHSTVVSKSPFQGLKWSPLNAAILQINTLGFPTLLILHQEMSPNFSSRMDSSAPLQHAEPEGSPE